MKKLNLICASIALLFAGAASAGTAVSTATKIAVENFGGAAAAQDTLPILGAPISYSMSSITAVNSGSTVYFTVRLTGGKFVSAPVAGAFTFAGQTCTAVPAVPGAPGCVVTLSTDKTTIKVAVTTGESYTLGLGAFGWTPTAAIIDNVNTTLGTVGGKVMATIGLVTINPTAIELADTQATIDAPLASGDLAVAAKGIATSAVSASTYTGKIDLTASPAASNYTTAGYAVLGAFKFTDAAAGAAKQRAGVNDYTLAAGSTNLPNTGATVVVTPGPGQTFPVGSVVSLHSNVTCSAVLAGAGATSAAVTLATAGTAKTLTTTTTIVTATDYFVCMSAPSAGNTATPIQASLNATVTPASTTDSIAPAIGGGYSLGYNGSTVDVVTYWPGRLETASTGYAGYVRLTNTGTVAAAVSGQHFNTSGVLVGTSTPLNVPGVLVNGILGAGESVLLSTAQIDAVVGVAPSGFTSGRIRFTAPTDGLRVQSMLQKVTGDGSGVPIEYRNVNPTSGALTY